MTSLPKLILAPATFADIDTLQTVLNAAPTYSVICNGRQPRDGDAKNVLSDLPPNKTAEGKFVYLVSLMKAAHGSDVIGCADVFRGYPNDETAFLGLLLLKEDFQKQGLGQRALLEIERIVQTWPEIRVLRLAVVIENFAAVRFWLAHGFVQIGPAKPYKVETFETNVLILEKPVRERAKREI